MFSSEFMGSDFYPNQNPEQQNQPSSCGLARYKSAPSSFLAALLDSNTTDNNSSSGDETEAFFSALLNQKKSTDSDSNGYNDVKQEVGVGSEGGSGSVGGEMGYESAVSGGGGCIVGSYSMGMESHHSLVKQSSSPAGFFNGFGVMGEAVGNYRVHSQPKSTGMTSNHHHISFSSAPSSSTRFMPTIPEDGNQGDVPTRNPENGQLRTVTSSPNGREFDAWINEMPFNSGGGLKRNRDGELRMLSDFNGLDNRNGETRKNPTSLVHHYSLPKTSAEMAEVEKFLQFQPESTVPCQVRAKRGCATHPRSIAERMRRTRISEKMKKLQDLFPNMDKQTSTADMLDLAVEYIKDLQKQVETLRDTKAKCICSSKPKQT